MNDNAFGKLCRVVLIGWVVVLVLSAGLLHARLAPRLDLDGGNTGDEAETLYALRSVRFGQTLYHDFLRPPHVLTQYTPLFYLVPGAVARVLGVGWLATFAVGRTYVYLFWFGCGAAIYGLVRSAGGDRLPATVAGLLWLASQLAPEMAITYRPDAVALFFSLAALWVYQRDQRAGAASVAIVLLVIAFLHKHSAVTALLAMLVEECRRQRFARAAWLAGLWGLVIGAVVLVAQAMTGGAFVLNVWGSLATFAGLAHLRLVLVLAMLGGLAAFLGGALACVTSQDARRPGLLKIYFGLAFLFALASSAKFGSGPNYYLEPFAAGCVLTGLWLTDWRVHGPAPGGSWVRLAWLALAVAAGISGLVARAVEFPSRLDEIVAHRAVRLQQTRAWDQLVARLGEWPEPVLIEDGYLALRRGTAPVLMNASNFAALEQSGRFDDTALLRRIATGGFSAIIASRPLEATGGFRHFPPRWIERMKQRYEPAGVERLGSSAVTFYVYRPKPAVPPQRAEPVPRSWRSDFVGRAGWLSPPLRICIFSQRAAAGWASPPYRDIGIAPGGGAVE